MTTEDEYFPPPPELREMLRALGASLGLLAGRPDATGTDPAAHDRTVSAADVLSFWLPEPPRCDDAAVTSTLTDARLARLV